MGIRHYYAGSRYFYCSGNNLDAQTTARPAKGRQKRQKSVLAKTSWTYRYLLVQEGDWVHQGDTLVVINSPEIHAKYPAGNALEQVAVQQNRNRCRYPSTDYLLPRLQLWNKTKVILH